MNRYPIVAVSPGNLGLTTTDELTVSDNNAVPLSGYTYGTLLLLLCVYGKKKLSKIKDVTCF